MVYFLVQIYREEILNSLLQNVNKYNKILKGNIHFKTVYAMPIHNF